MQGHFLSSSPTGQDPRQPSPAPTNLLTHRHPGAGAQNQRPASASSHTPSASYSSHPIRCKSRSRTRHTSLTIHLTIHSALSPSTPHDPPTPHRLRQTHQRLARKSQAQMQLAAERASARPATMWVQHARRRARPSGILHQTLRRLPATRALPHAPSTTTHLPSTHPPTTTHAPITGRSPHRRAREHCSTERALSPLRSSRTGAPSRY